MKKRNMGFVLTILLVLVIALTACTGNNNGQRPDENGGNNENSGNTQIVNTAVKAAVDSSSSLDVLTNCIIKEEIRYDDYSTLSNYSIVEWDGQRAYCYRFYDYASKDGYVADGTYKALDSKIYLERLKGENDYYHRYYLTGETWRKSFDTDIQKLGSRFEFDIFAILKKLNVDDFAGNGDAWTLNAEAYNAVAVMPEMLNVENLKDFSLTLSEGKLSAFRFTCGVSNVRTYIYTISYPGNVSVTLPSSYVDNTSEATKFNILSGVLDKISALQITNFTVDMSAVDQSSSSGINIIGRVMSVDKNNFAVVQCDSDGKVVDGSIYTKEEGKFYVSTIDTTTKQQVKTQTTTENTLLTLSGGSALDFSRFRTYNDKMVIEITGNTYMLTTTLATPSGSILYTLCIHSIDATLLPSLIN